MSQGISHLNLESYMSWIPLVGSLMGALLGGVIADVIASAAATDSSSSASAADAFASAQTTPLADPLTSSSLSPETSMMPMRMHTQNHNHNHNHCADNGDNDGGDHRDAPISIFTASVRAVVAGVGTLIATPFALVALILMFPACFLVFIPSGLVSSECIRRRMRN